MSLTYRSLSTAPTYRKKSGTSVSERIQNATLRLASLGVDSQASSTLQSLQRSAAGRGTYTEVPFSLKSIPSVQGAGRAPSVSAGSVNPMNVIDSRLGQDLGKAVRQQFFNPFDYRPTKLSIALGGSTIPGFRAAPASSFTPKTSPLES